MAIEISHIIEDWVPEKSKIIDFTIVLQKFQNQRPSLAIVLNSLGFSWRNQKSMFLKGGPGLEVPAEWGYSDRVVLHEQVAAKVSATTDDKTQDAKAWFFGGNVVKKPSAADDHDKDDDDDSNGDDVFAGLDFDSFALA